MTGRPATAFSTVGVITMSESSHGPSGWASTGSCGVFGFLDFLGGVVVGSSDTDPVGSPETWVARSTPLSLPSSPPPKSLLTTTPSTSVTPSSSISRRRQ